MAHHQPRTDLLKAKRFAFVLQALTGAAILVLMGGCQKPEASFDDPAFWMASTNIIFTQRGFGEPDKHVSVTDSNTLARLLTTVRLEPKEPCNCPEHSLEVLFLRPGGNVAASFCDHCFILFDPDRPKDHKRTRLCKMPKEFYAQFLKLVLEQIPDKWEF